MSRKTGTLKRALSMLLAAVVVVGCVSLPLPTMETKAETTYPFMDTSLSFEERAADLVSRMTLEEKISQLGHDAPSISRLNISKYNYWSEGLHGVARSGEATSFPYSIAMAASWDTALVEEITDAIADEARGYANGKGKGLSYWSPTVNMARDPRWGRNHESYGEDPFLTTAIGSAFVDGLQGDDQRYLKAIATIKHYAANNHEKNRNSSSSNMADSLLREYYTRAFKGIARQADVESVMSAYNRVNEIPSSANEYLLNTLLRQTFGFDGYVVSDCGAIENVYKDHKWVPEGWDRAVTPAEAVYFCLAAGCDLECGSVYKANAMEAVETGLLSEDMIDIALLRSYTARMKTGEFDPKEDVPYRSEAYSFANQVENAAHKQLAEDSANDAIVLLQNDNDTLPLDIATQKNIVMIGEVANEVELSDYSGTPSAENMSTPIQGMQALGATVTYIEGGTQSGEQQNGTYICNLKNVVLHKANGSTVTLEPRNAQGLTNCKLDGGNGNIGDIRPGASLMFKDVNIENVTSITFQIAGDNTVLAGTVTMTMDSKGGMRMASVDTVKTGGWQTYTDLSCAVNDLGGATVKDLYLSFDLKRQDVSFTETETQQIKNADAVIVCLNGADSWEGTDRATIAMPDYQIALANTAASLNDNTIVYMQTVGVVEVDEFADNVQAILWTSFNGQAQGNAMARVIYGVANPTAKLPMTWYADNAELPHINDYELRGMDGSNGWTYQYFSGTYTYPFGYGLSYSSYEYRNLTIVGGSSSYRVGDVDGNGSVEVSDALLALQAATRKVTLTTAQELRADVNSSDKIEADDALNILQCATAKITLPIVDGGEDVFTPDDTLTVTVDVENTSEVDGKEVVQLYVAVPNNDGVHRPFKQLKAFDKVAIAAGETKTVALTVDLSDCYFWDEEQQKNVYDQGEYTLFVGPSADESTALTTNFTMDGELTPELAVVTLQADALTLNAADTDKVITSELTAVLNDDSFYDLEKGNATVTYTSADPSIATVDENGVVHAVSGGVTTITASVTLDGKTLTDSFPVVVLVRLNGIQVNGQDYADFRADQTEYYIPVEGTVPPVITVPGVPAEYVTVQNATSVPGDATVTVTIDGASNVYTIHFKTRSTDYVAASFSGAEGTYTLNNEQLYINWTNADGGKPVDLTRYTLSDLHLRMVFELKRISDSSGYTDKQVFDSGYIKLRSSDTNGAENNIGWQSRNLNLKTGVNYIDIPLDQTVETQTGTIDWTTLQRLHIALFSLKDIGSFEVTVSHVMIVDVSLDPAREELWELYREEIVEDQYLESSLPPYRAAKEAIRPLLFKPTALTQQEAETAKNEYLTAQAGLKRDTYMVGTFSKSEGTWTVLGQSGESLYVDWKQGDNVPFDLSGDRTNLRLQMTLEYQSNLDTVAPGDVWKNLTVKLRSSDVENKLGDTQAGNKEHNIGWDFYPTQGGDNSTMQLSIDLSSAGTNKRGIIDWADIRQLIIISSLTDTAKNAAKEAGLLNNEFSVIIRDVQIINLTDVMVEQAAIKTLLNDTVDTSDATAEQVQAYTNARATAEAVCDTEWVSLIEAMQARDDLQAAIAAIRGV